MKFDISVFRFDAASDYDAYFKRLGVEINDEAHLEELLAQIAQTLGDFAYDKKSFGFRINGIVVFQNLSVAEILAHFGERLEFTPISSKYALKDLLIDKDAIFALYKEKLDSFAFLGEESKLEFKKYIYINLISPLDMGDYVGDGYCLFIKWMMIHYKDSAQILLDSIAGAKDGVMNSIRVAHLIYPPDSSIDSEIESLQRTLLQSPKLAFRQNPWAKMSENIETLFAKGASNKAFLHHKTSKARQ